MCTDCHFILFVILVDQELVTTYRCERYTIFLIQTPAIELFTKLRWFKLIYLSLLICGVWILVIPIFIAHLAFGAFGALRDALFARDTLLIFACWYALPVRLLDFSRLNMGFKSLKVTSDQVFFIKLRLYPWLSILVDALLTVIVVIFSCIGLI